MILPDTSVWIDHFRHGTPTLVSLLENEDVLLHPFVLGELALGHLPNRVQILEDLQARPQALVATPDDVLRFIDEHRLTGAGLGYVDVHLLVSSSTMPDTALWTLDKKLLAAAERLSLAMRLS